MRIVLLTLEALAAATAVRRFVAEAPAAIALVGLSEMHRPAEGGASEQGAKHLKRSGWRILPYLYANFTLPHLAPRRPGAGVERQPLAETCAKLGVPLARVDDVNDPAFQRQIAQSGADLIVCFHFDQILSPETIASAPLGGVNVHAGLLPHHRGPVPTIHALLDQTPAFGVTIHRITPAIDAGPILAQATLDLPTSTSAMEAARQLHDVAAPLLRRVMADIAAGQAVERPFEPLPYCGWPTREQLKSLSRRGRSTARWADLVRALRTPT